MKGYFDDLPDGGPTPEEAAILAEEVENLLSDHPAVAEVSHIQTVDAQLTSQLPVPLGELHSAPLLANQQTPADFDNYVKTRTATWKAAKAQGHAPRG